MTAMKNTLFITGTSSGLGHAFAKYYLRKEWQVYGISRRRPDTLTNFPNFHFESLDLEDLDQIPLTLDKLFKEINEIDLVLLNAALLGTIGEMTKASLPELKRLMDTNVWANKVVLDYLLSGQFKLRHIIAISSGAAVNGNHGWGGYSISKAALNMLTQLYAREFPHIHFTALAPGLIDTSMQDYLCETADGTRFPSVKTLKAARNTPAMPKPDVAAQNIVRLFPKLLDYESGAFVDIRKI